MSTDPVPCPRCGEQLEGDKRGDLSALSCSDRDGLLVGDDTISSMIGHEAHVEVWNAIDSGVPSKIRCPLCEVRFQTAFIRRVHIDGCMRDRLVWLDGWEITTFKNPPSAPKRRGNASPLGAANDAIGLLDLMSLFSDLF